MALCFLLYIDAQDDDVRCASSRQSSKWKWKTKMRREQNVGTQERACERVTGHAMNMSAQEFRPHPYPMTPASSIACAQMQRTVEQLSVFAGFSSSETGFIDTCDAPACCGLIDYRSGSPGHGRNVLLIHLKPKCYTLPRQVVLHHIPMYSTLQLQRVVS